MRIVTKKGGSKRLKRIAAPVTYKIPRKRFKWVIKPIPGPHPADNSIPIGVLIRDILRIANDLREVKYILRQGYVEVDGKKIKTYKYPVGLMDVIHLVPSDIYYRIVPDKISYLKPLKIIDEKEKNIKPLLIKNKVMVKGGYIQLTSHDGRNFRLENDNEYSKLKPGDTLIYDFREGRLEGYIRFEKGNLAVIYWGSKRGMIGKIVETRKPHPLKPRIAILDVEGKHVETVFEYVFPIGIDYPIVSLGERHE